MTLPTGSRSPALFQTLSLVADPIAFFDRYSAKYGDTFTARVLGPSSPPVVFLGSPEAIQAVFTTLADAFEFGKVTNVFRPLVGNESLIMNEGPRHLRQRQLLMPALHREQLHSQGI
jgi:cytochrome P450